MARQDDIRTIRIESGTIIRLLAFAFAALLALKFLEHITTALLLIAIAFFLALALNPAVSRISQMLKLKSRAAATGIAYLLVLAFLAAFIAFVFPPLVKQTADFIQEVPSSIQDFKENDSTARDFVQRYGLEEQINRFTDDFGSRFGDIGKPVLSTAGAIGAAVAQTITVLVLTFMMLVEGHGWLERLWSAQPAAKRAHRRKLAQDAYRTVTNYVNGQIFIAALAGFFAAIALFIFREIFDANVNPIALGGIVSLFALLPLIGTTIGAIIVVLACLLVSFPLAVAAAIFFLVYQQIENVTIQPYVQSRTNNLTPLIVFISAIIGVSVGGIFGAFVAIPVAGCLKILVEDYYGHKLTPKETKTA